MLLNRVEKLLMNNPVRAGIQRRVEARRLLELGGSMAGGRALEVGCGRGVGAALILELFKADRVDAFDLDPDMIERAQARLAGYGDRVRLWTGDVSNIAAADDAYDAVFDFGIIHHVPGWREALVEIHRVLAPGGRFYVEEIYRRLIDHRLMRRTLDHPEGDRFDHAQLGQALVDAGFRVRAERSWADVIGWYVADKPAS
ncbi:class I SAM-dependent methyltransferase [Haliangium sp.]|uniref:class I SAM-dependent methyltransferase n=1 Tax=Haliangium sp. TaxID=2663208 RepID=UPI003D127DCC